ncbi:MAG TPA: AI-2E family transporter [Gammaproteobacteria bacterium]|nr:AI-2E family transporter [Gammaproteobacteria bacterium]
MDDEIASAWERRILLGVFLGGLLLLSYITLHRFLGPVVWAGILVYVTWPLYRRLRLLLRGRASIGALVMTLFLFMAFALPLLWLLAELRDELTTAYQAMTSYLHQGPPSPPAFIDRIPWLSEWWQRLMDKLAGDPEAIKGQVLEWVKRFQGELANMVGDVGLNAIKLLFALFTVFFFYRDGEGFLREVQQVLERLLGQRVNVYLLAIGDTTKAVVYGLVLAALTQGMFAGIGYWAVGLQAPVLLGILTVLVALIPFGAPLVWVPLGVWLLFTGQTWPGLGLLLWGALVVSWVDNLVRPMVISGATRIPFLLVTFGVLGGLAAFGLIGLFLGPVILAVLVAVWREWVQEQTADRPEGS